MGSNLVPFKNNFPKDTKLYELMTTKAGEGFFAGTGKTPGSSSDKPHNSSDESEVLRKIREVAGSNADFEDIMNRYLEGM